MFAVQGLRTRLYPTCIRISKMSGEWGSGAGKGGGGGGSIREAGGAFGKMEVAREEEYFYNKQKELLHKLKEDKIALEEFHQKQIADHEEAIQRHKEYLNKLKK